MNQTSSLAFSIDRSSKVPIFEQICLAIRTRAITGELAKGRRLPATRVLATELGVSRSTIITAYEQLVAEGYLQSAQGSGYTVCEIGEVELSGQRETTPRKDVEEPAKPRRPFEAGLPDMRLFPHRQWAKAVARVCRTNPEAMLIGGTTFGNLALRKEIASHVSEWRGIDASPHQIVVTAGSTDALEICIRTLAQPGEFVGLENPGFLPVRHFAQSYGLRPLYLNIDGNGAELPSGEVKPRVLVLTPSHQYPLGGAMSPNRRIEYLRCAEANDAWIIEDDYDSEFRFAGRPIPAMAGLDRLKRSIYVGSFSKIFSNSLRLGYIVAPEILLDRLRSSMEKFGLKASFMPQQALADFMETGEFYRHLRRVRRVYGQRRKHLLDRLGRDFSEIGHFEDHDAGMQVVFHLNGAFGDVEVCDRANAKGVNIMPLSGFSKQDTSYNGIIMGYCGYSEDEADAALEVLSACFSEAKQTSGRV